MAPSYSTHLPMREILSAACLLRCLDRAGPCRSPDQDDTASGWDSWPNERSNDVEAQHSLRVHRMVTASRIDAQSSMESSTCTRQMDIFETVWSLVQQQTTSEVKLKTQTPQEKFLVPFAQYFEEGSLVSGQYDVKTNHPSIKDTSRIFPSFPSRKMLRSNSR